MVPTRRPPLTIRLDRRSLIPLPVVAANVHVFDARKTTLTPTIIPLLTTPARALLPPCNPHLHPSPLDTTADTPCLSPFRPPHPLLLCRHPHSHRSTLSIQPPLFGGAVTCVVTAMGIGCRTVMHVNALKTATTQTYASPCPVKRNEQNYPLVHSERAHPRECGRFRVEMRESSLVWGARRLAAVHPGRPPPLSSMSTSLTSCCPTPPTRKTAQKQNKKHSRADSVGFARGRVACLR
ncbi:hypothetical protein R3P38DRAFT_1328370 [Favolaschia claudopus]|uniref:Uncharacterized protein n=1 Tax=Favolaschia claudopus TaxID=2862362 RepID=A0AAW0AVN6_9AGAR